MGLAGLIDRWCSNWKSPLRIPARSLNHGTLRGCSLAADAPDPRQGFARDVDKVPRGPSSSRSPFPESRYQGVIVTSGIL